MKKIACIGSATMDVMVSSVDTMPPAGTLYAVNSTSLHPGGCAVNVALDLGKLGFPAAAANKVVQSIAKEQNDATVEQLIKLALKQL